MNSADPALAGDAAFLLARSMDRPAERAAVLGRYLARRPPAPYRQQALVDQANAFLDADDAPTARAIVVDLHADPALPDVVRPSLARLDTRVAKARVTK